MFFFVVCFVGMCSIEYTPSEVQNGMEAFDLGAVAAATAANAATAQVFTFNQIYEYSIVLSKSSQ